MGTILAISSHSPFATEAAIGVRLLLFRPAAFLLPKQDSGNPGLSGGACYSITFRLSFLSHLAAGLPGRNVIQAYVVVSLAGVVITFSSLRGRSPLFPEAL
jgi:hypothetical protein